MRISDWSSDVCSSDLPRIAGRFRLVLLPTEAELFDCTLRRNLTGPARPAGLRGECPPASAWRRLPPPCFRPEGLPAAPVSPIAVFPTGKSPSVPLRTPTPQKV